MLSMSHNWDGGSGDKEGKRFVEYYTIHLPKTQLVAFLDMPVSFTCTYVDAKQTVTGDRFANAR